jgi:nucleoside-diphosphate kinase
MKQPALVIVKPDGIVKNLTGHVFTKFAETKLKIVALKVVRPTKNIVEEHYIHIKGKPFFKPTVDYFCGKYHHVRELIALIYYGESAIKKCRQTAGATNPEEAAPGTIRGSCGRITTTDIYENVVHVSSDVKDSKREIQLWFEPSEIIVNLYPTKTITVNKQKKRVWL